MKVNWGNSMFSLSRNAAREDLQIKYRPEGSDPLTKFFHAIANQEKPQKNWVGQPRTISKKCVGAPGDVLD